MPVCVFLCVCVGVFACVRIIRATLVIMSDSSLPENTPKKTHAAIHICGGKRRLLQTHAWISTGTDACVQANRHANTLLRKDNTHRVLLTDENLTSPKCQHFSLQPFLIDSLACETTVWKVWKGCSGESYHSELTQC